MVTGMIAARWMQASPAVFRGGAGLRTGDGADDPGRRTKAYPAALPPRFSSPPGGLFHFGGQRNLSEMWRKMLRPSRLSISHGKNEANNGGGKAI